MDAEKADQGTKKRARHHRGKRSRAEDATDAVKGLAATADSREDEVAEMPKKDHAKKRFDPSEKQAAVKTQQNQPPRHQSSPKVASPSTKINKKVAVEEDEEEEDDDDDEVYGHGDDNDSDDEEVEDFTTADVVEDDGIDGGEGGDSATHRRIKMLKSQPDAVADFRELNLNPHIVSALEQEFQFKLLTAIQSQAIPAALSGRDLLAEAKTGAGKTLAFLIPIVENITRAGFKAVNGTASVIIGPTRELCQQIEGVLLRLLKFFNGSITFICCIGGQNRKQEGFKLASGQMIVVSSPGRLLDHLRLTSEWNTRNLLMLAIDEADRVLDNGFEEDLREIVGLLPKRRQTFLFSATQTTRVEQLARVSFNKTPVFISMKSREDKATVDTLEQGYVICPAESRLCLLYHFVKRNLDKKVIVFFSSRNAVSFHCELFNYVDVPCVAFHGKQKQHQRSATYMQFCNAPSGVLFTTDVAARGLDIPKVDWIVQFDPSDDPVKYIHRVGRTARAGRVGSALMFLQESEKLFLKYLYQDAHVSVNEYAFNMDKVNSIQEQFQKLITSNYYLRTSARQAYEGYLLSYSASQMKNVFDVQKLDLTKVARGFGLTDPPQVRLDLSQSAAHINKKARKEFKQTQKSKNMDRRQMGAKKIGSKNVSGEW